MRSYGMILLAVVGCSDARDVHTLAQPIVGGHLDYADPATVYLDVGCSGTLVSPRTVLTAEHCLEETIAVYFGANADDVTGTWIDVVHAAGHPTADLAMLTLAEPAPTLPVALNDDDLDAHIGRSLRIVGFGVTSEDGDDVGVKRAAVATLAEVEDDIMYATNTPSGTCYGDSGGPNFMTIAGGERLIGVTSFGTEECGSGLDGSVRVDWYYDWIVDYIAAHDEAPSAKADDADLDKPAIGHDDDLIGGCAASGGATGAWPIVLALGLLVVARRRSRMRALAIVVATVSASCVVGEESPLSTPGLDDDFAAAARTYDVPADLLRAIAYVETRWQSVEAEEHAGHAGGAGVFGLSGDNLVLGAAAAGIDPDVARRDLGANLAAAAARLAMLARAHQVAGSDLSTWSSVIADFAQTADAEARAAYVDDVIRVLATGARRLDEDGTLIASIDPHRELPMPANTGGERAAVDFPGAVWRSSPNYGSRGAYGVSLVVIHSCEGSYASCWGYLRTAGVSAHYVVKEDGSEVTQLVREANRAWHVAASYDCARAGNQQCEYDGVSTNNFAVGIEHAGYASQASWSSGLLDTSAKLTCAVTKAHDIPRDRDHIVSHGQLQPWNRVDPGPNWPWDDYIDRVRAHCGDGGGGGGGGGGNATIIVDSNSANNDPQVAKLELIGAWTASTNTAGYYGTGYWVAQTAPTTAPANFWFYVPSAGTRTIDAWWTTGSDRTAATFVAFDAAGDEVGRSTVDQRTQGSQWVTLGAWNFRAGWNRVALSRWTSAGKVVIADAVRIR